MPPADRPDEPSRALPSTIAEPVVHEIVIKKSRFITRLAPVASVAEADDVVAQVRKEFWDARHNCVALSVGSEADQQRSNDDGEPSGTAGIPMLEVLRQRQMTDVVAVVTRYFGGVMLGAGGLVRAYSGSVSSALDEARVVRRVRMQELLLEVPHADAGRIEHFLRDWLSSNESRLEGIEYGASALFTLLVPPHQCATLDAAVAAASSGELTAVEIGARVADLPV